MPTRFNTSFNGGLRTGYDRRPTAELSVPSCGIEDVDLSLFRLFDNEIRFEVSRQDEVRQVPVIFAAGEKWAMLKRGRALRDKNGVLILPLITILRTDVKQDPTSDITGRGVNQQTGEMVIRRRLDKTDRGFQNLINRLYLKNQKNLAVTPAEASDGQVSTSRTIGDLAEDPTVLDGGLLAPDKLRNVYEIITIPTPQYFSATYQITFWTQYTEHMNQMLEKLMSSYLPQGNAWRLDVKDKGYWFVATVDGNEYTPENNEDDMTGNERIIKCSFTVRVPAYVLASDTPGAPVPVRRYVSAAAVTFEVSSDVSTAAGIADGGSTTADPFLGSDDPTLPSADGKSRRRDQRFTGKNRRLAPPDAMSPDDPSLLSYPRGVNPPSYRSMQYRDGVTGKLFTKKVREQIINPYTGETVFSGPSDLDSLITTIVDD